MSARVTMILGLAVATALTTIAAKPSEKSESNARSRTQPTVRPSANPARPGAIHSKDQPTNSGSSQPGQFAIPAAADDIIVGGPVSTGDAADPQEPVEQTTPSAYTIEWQCISTGGEPTMSPNYEMNGTMGQPAAGSAVSPAYAFGIGYWYGGLSSEVCLCPHQADLDGNGFVDATDLAFVIDIVFFGGADIGDPGCPNTRADFNADGFADATDLAFLIDHVFFGGPGPVDPCAQ